jgi:hypothetical protein
VKGRCGLAVLAHASVPARRSTRTQSSWPCAHAQCSAVQPASSRMLQ